MIPWKDIITVGSSLFGNLFAANMQSNAADRSSDASAAAARYSADLMAKANADALQFSREGAENSFLNNEAARSGNYGQWAARERRLGTLGEEVEMGPREIPSYVPGVDPGWGVGGSSSSSSGAGGGSSTDAANLKALIDGGLDPRAAVAQFNKQYNRSTGNEAVYYDPAQHGGVATIGLPDAYLAKPGASWDITVRGGGSTPAPAANPRRIQPLNGSSGVADTPFMNLGFYA